MADAALTADLAATIRLAFERGEELGNLAARAGVSERKINSIMRVEFTTTNLQTADRILEALGETTALLNGSVRVGPDGRSTRRNPSRHH